MGDGGDIADGGHVDIGTENGEVGDLGGGQNGGGIGGSHGLRSLLKVLRAKFFVGRHCRVKGVVVGLPSIPSSREFSSRPVARAAGSRPHQSR